MVSRLPAAARARGHGGAVAFGALLALALFAALFPVFPGRALLREGARAPRTVTALRDFSYESAVLTE
ncbi:MAG: hypothetical protein EXR65_01380 [Dehalococcoidia bacterium]|nr:hypothetical protein [Dehalococcoidia bacterium]